MGAVLNRDSQSTYIELRYRGTSAHYTCLLAVYALVRIKHCCELNLTGPTDGHRKVTAAVNRGHNHILTTLPC